MHAILICMVYTHVIISPAAVTTRSATVCEPAAGSNTVALCAPAEPGEKLAFSGRIHDYQGRPLKKASIVAYHADRQGLYNPPEARTRVPRLRGVAVTDRRGGFRFATIRPGPYPNGSEPAHIHLEITAPAHRIRYVTYWFEGDPLITDERRAKAARDPEVVIVKLTRGPLGAWTFSHDIRLEAN